MFNISQCGTKNCIKARFMKKSVSLVVVCFIAVAIIACSSDEDVKVKVHPVSNPSIFEKQDLEQVVHNGDIIEIESLIQDSYMCYVTTEDMKSGLYTTPEGYKILSSDPMRFKALESSGKELDNVATFHWLTMRHESPIKYVFIINCEEIDTIKEIYLTVVSPFMGKDNVLHFVLN